MAKLVILTQGMTSRIHELTVDKTTIGRVEDNTFQIAEPSVSSHHCEIILRGGEIAVKDLNSTNGTYIAGEKTAEGVLKPGQTLRLGNVELRLEASAAAATPAAAPASAKKAGETPKTAPRGVSLSDLEGGGRPPGFDTSKEFSKKRKRSGVYFWLFAAVVVLVIVVLLISEINSARK